MSYRFTYPIVGRRKYPTRKGIAGKLLPVMVLIAAFGAISIYYGSLRWLLPGDPDVTEAALNELIDRLTHGETFSEAVSVFCKEIIAGAG